MVTYICGQLPNQAVGPLDAMDAHLMMLGMDTLLIMEPQY